MNKKALEKYFKNWIDFDGAAYNLALIQKIYTEKKNPFTSVKGIFWTKNKTSDRLYKKLNDLVKQGILEQNEECQFRLKNSGQ